NRWAVLALLSVAQLMVVLDATIVTIAIPSAQKALHFSTESRQWIVTAYALAFGSLLLVGGKVGDLFGRKWTLIARLIGFSAAWWRVVNQTAPDRARIDIPGTLAWTLGLFALVFGFSNAETHGWGATVTVVALSGSPLLLSAFVLIERRGEHPLI